MAWLKARLHNKSTFLAGKLISTETILSAHSHVLTFGYNIFTERFKIFLHKVKYIPPNREYAKPKNMKEEGVVAQARIQLSHVKNVIQKLIKESMLILLISILLL